MFNKNVLRIVLVIMTIGSISSTKAALKKVAKQKPLNIVLTLGKGFLYGLVNQNFDQCLPKSWVDATGGSSDESKSISNHFSGFSPKLKKIMKFIGIGIDVICFVKKDIKKLLKGSHTKQELLSNQAKKIEEAKKLKDKVKKVLKVNQLINKAIEKQEKMEKEKQIKDERNKRKQIQIPKLNQSKKLLKAAPHPTVIIHKKVENKKTISINYEPQHKEVNTDSHSVDSDSNENVEKEKQFHEISNQNDEVVSETNDDSTNETEAKPDMATVLEHDGKEKVVLNMGKEFDDDKTLVSDNYESPTNPEINETEFLSTFTHTYKKLSTYNIFKKIKKGFNKAGDTLKKGANVVGKQVVKTSKNVGNQVVKTSKNVGNQVVKTSKKVGKEIAKEAKKNAEIIAHEAEKDARIIAKEALKDAKIVEKGVKTSLEEIKKYAKILKSVLKNLELMKKLKEVFEYIKQFLRKIKEFIESDTVKQIFAGIKKIVKSCATKMVMAVLELTNIMLGFNIKMGQIATVAGIVEVGFDLLCNWKVFLQAIEALMDAIQSSGLERIKYLGEFFGDTVRAIGGA